MCMSVLPACMAVYVTCARSAWCAWRLEKGMLSPGTGITDGCELPCESRVSPGYPVWVLWMSSKCS